MKLAHVLDSLVRVMQKEFVQVHLCRSRVCWSGVGLEREMCFTRVKRCRGRDVQKLVFDLLLLVAKISSKIFSFIFSELSSRNCEGRKSEKAVHSQFVFAPENNMKLKIPVLVELK